MIILVEFIFFDLIVGYVINFDLGIDIFGFKIIDGREFKVKLIFISYVKLV